jgi:acetyl-CoA synthetase
MSGVIGREDSDRGEIIVAYVVLAQGQKGSDGLKSALQDHVRANLAAHEYPREVVFIDDLPMTVTGKIQRSVLRQVDQRRAR